MYVAFHEYVSKTKIIYRMDVVYYKFINELLINSVYDLL